MGSFRVKYKRNGRELYQTVVIEMEGVEKASEALKRLKEDSQMYRELNYSGVEIIDVENVLDTDDL